MDTVDLDTAGLFLNPIKTENQGFFMFSGGVEKDQWHEMGQYTCSAHLQSLFISSTIFNVCFLNLQGKIMSWGGSVD